MTVAYPDVVKFLLDFIGKEGQGAEAVQDFIIDAELVAYDKATDRIQPF